MERDFELLKNNLLFLKNEYLMKLLDIANDVIKKDKIEIVFSGKLATGKTTIINNLIEKDILPTGIGTTTKSINTIINSNEDKIEAIFDDRKETYEFNKDIIDKLNETSGIKALNLYLKEFPFLSVVFVDTPGIDELKESIENLTLSKIPTADAVVFVMDIAKGLTKKDKEFFDDYITKFFRDKIFIVFNKLDTIQDEITEDDLEKIREPLKDYPVYFFSAKNVDDNFKKFKNDLFKYIEETDKNKVKKFRLLSIISAIDEISKKQLNSLIENKNKTKEELENKLKELIQNRNEIENKLKELEIKVDEQISNIINNRIIPIIDEKRQEVITRALQIDPDNLKSYLTYGIKNDLKIVIDNIKRELNRNLDVQIPEISGLTFSSIIVSLVDVIGKFLDPILQRFNLPDITDIIQNFIRDIAKESIKHNINTFFDKFRDSVIYSIERAKRDYFEELKLKEYGDIDAQKIAIEQNLEFIGKDKTEIESEIDFYRKKINNISEIIQSIKQKIETQII